MPSCLTLLPRCKQTNKTKAKQKLPRFIQGNLGRTECSSSSHLCGRNVVERGRRAGRGEPEMRFEGSKKQEARGRD